MEEEPEPAETAQELVEEREDRTRAILFSSCSMTFGGHNDGPVTMTEEAAPAASALSPGQATPASSQHMDTWTQLGLHHALAMLLSEVRSSTAG